MSTNKRKTVQIKRPDPSGKGPKPARPLPKVSVSDSAASVTDSGDIQPVTPPQDTKSATTRISLPDEAKIRKARRADAPKEDELPKAEEVMQAAKNATAQIVIDTEEVKAPQRELDTKESGTAAEQTMQIGTQELQAVDEEEEDAGATSKIPLDQIEDKTGEATRVETGELKEVGDDEMEGGDRTMKIDADALQTGDVGQALKDADKELEKGQSDATMKIDADALQTGDIDEVSRDELHAMETMQMDPVEVEKEISKKPPVDDEAFKAATVAIDPSAEAGSEEGEEAPLTAEQMKESFNAQTMAMDPSELEQEMQKQKGHDSTLDQTMDLTEQRPKTILIKRPSREAPAAPTVKTVRPDAQTVRTARPVPRTAMSDEQKAGTSRVDVPIATTPEGKTVKLRRPGGSSLRPGAPVSRVATSAGLEIGEDGSVRSTAPAKAPSLGAAWMVLSVFTFLICLGALYIAFAIEVPDLPMVGRLVDVNNQILSL